MALLYFVCLTSLVCFEAAQAQCFGRPPPHTPVVVKPSPTAPVVQHHPVPSQLLNLDLNTLLVLANAFEAHSPPPQTSGVNADEIIMKLVNALIYTTTHCNCGQVGSSNIGGGHSHAGSTGAISASSSNGRHDSSLIDLDLLKGNELLDLGLGGNSVLSLGIGNERKSGGGGRGSAHSGSRVTQGGAGSRASAHSLGRPSSSGSSLIDLDVAKGDDLLDLSLAGNPLLSVGLGGERKSGGGGGRGSVHSSRRASHGSAGSKATTHSHGSRPNSGGSSLIDLDVARGNDLLDLSLSGNSVLSVGLGDDEKSGGNGGGLVGGLVNGLL